jgi:hypothetical protein
MSPGIAEFAIDENVAGVTARTVAPAIGAGIGRVRTVTVRVSQPPSGSRSASSIS